MRSVPSGASADAMAAATAAAHHNMKAASCLTHLLSYFGGGPGGACGPSGEDENADEVAARMRRSMSSRGMDPPDNGGVTHAHGGQQPQHYAPQAYR